jgi:NAD+ diphosphatase
LIHRDDQILMARSPHFPPGVYGLIAGFVEAGESVEEAVHREVKEEVGLAIKNLRYFGSQAWPFPDSLMIGFFAEYESGDLLIDHSEIEEAGWYHYDQLPGHPSVTISIAYKLIKAFIAEKKGTTHGAL